MPAGFQSITPEGIAQVDSESKSYVLKAQGVASGSNTYRTIVVSNCISPLLFLGAGAGVVGVQRVGNEFTWAIICTSSANVNWWVYDTMPVTTPSTYGMQLFNAAAELTFDALYKPASVVHIEPPANALSISVTSGRTYGIHFGGAWKNFQRNVIGGGGFGNVEIVNRYLTMQVSGSSLTVGANAVETIQGLDPGPGYNGQTSPILMIVADMTSL